MAKLGEVAVESVDECDGMTGDEKEKSFSQFVSCLDSDGMSLAFNSPTANALEPLT
jgi:hypothetical protein